MRLANSKMIGHGGVLLPSQDDLLPRMQCAKFVAVADISSAFHALEYDKETASKMRISHRGTHYIFKRVIMGALPSSQMLEQAVLMMFNQNDFAIFLKDKSCCRNKILFLHGNLPKIKFQYSSCFCYGFPPLYIPSCPNRYISSK